MVLLWCVLTDMANGFRGAWKRGALLAKELEWG